MTLDDFLNAPFKRRPHFGRKSRFSDGSFGVYYSALEKNTAQTEAEDVYRKLVMDGTSSGTSRVAYYRCVSCRFDGIAMDLQPQADSMPELVGPDYDPCIAIAKDARSSDVDALLTPSAACARRFRSGTCLPVFTQASLSDATEDGDVQFVFR